MNGKFRLAVIFGHGKLGRNYGTDSVLIMKYWAAALLGTAVQFQYLSSSVPRAARVTPMLPHFLATTVLSTRLFSVAAALPTIQSQVSLEFREIFNYASVQWIRASDVANIRSAIIPMPWMEVSCPLLYKPSTGHCCTPFESVHSLISYNCTYIHTYIHTYV